MDDQRAANLTAGTGADTAGASAAGPQDVQNPAGAAGKPLSRLKIACAGKVGMTKLKRIVTKLGGENTTTLNSTV